MERRPGTEKESGVTTCRYPDCGKRAISRGFCDGHRKQRDSGIELRPLGQERPPRALLPNPGRPDTLLVPLADGRFAIVDKSDGPIVARRNWHAVVREHSLTVYARSSTAQGRPSVSLHRLLWGAWSMPATPEIDHENRDGLDCRRANLRAATGAQNCSNVAMRRSNRSGLKGVSWHAHSSKWRATIQSNKKAVHLGLFDDASEAHAAYVAAAKDLHREFARSR